MEWMLNDEGLFEEYDDTYDVVIHCDSEEARNEVLADLKAVNDGFDILDKIEDEINSPNRGTCDYFIVDRIEEIINKYKAESEGKALWQQPNRCDSCIHFAEQDGSNCYECVKGIADNFEAQQTDADCISRQAVDEYITNLLSGYLYDEERTRLEDLSAFVWELPSVTPTRPTGQWFIDERPESNREIVCSNCDQPIFKYHKLDFDYRPKYCPNCGARMGESEDK